MNRFLFSISAAFVGVFLFNAIKSKPSYELQNSASTSIESSIVNCKSHSPQYFQERILEILADENLEQGEALKIKQFSRCLIQELTRYTPDFDVFNLITSLALNEIDSHEKKLLQLKAYGVALNQSANEQQKKQIKSSLDYIEFFIVGLAKGDSYNIEEAINVLEEIVEANTQVNGDKITQSFVCDAYRTLSIHYFLNNSGNDNYFKILDEGIAKSDKEYKYGIGCHAILSLMKAHLITVNQLPKLGSPEVVEISYGIKETRLLLAEFQRFESFKSKKIALVDGLKNQANILNAYIAIKISDKEGAKNYLNLVERSWKIKSIEKERYLQYWFSNDVYFETLLMMRDFSIEEGTTRIQYFREAEKYIKENIVHRVFQNQSVQESKYYRRIVTTIHNIYFSRLAGHDMSSEELKEPFSIYEINYNRALRSMPEGHSIEKAILYADRAGVSISYENGKNAERYTNQCLENAQHILDKSDARGYSLIFACASRLFLAACEQEISVSNPRKYFHLLNESRDKTLLTRHKFKRLKSVLQNNCKHVVNG